MRYAWEAYAAKGSDRLPSRNGPLHGRGRSTMWAQGWREPSATRNTSAPPTWLPGGSRREECLKVRARLGRELSLPEVTTHDLQGLVRVA